MGQREGSARGVTRGRFVLGERRRPGLTAPATPGSPLGLGCTPLRGCSCLRFAFRIWYEPRALLLGLKHLIAALGRPGFSLMSSRDFDPRAKIACPPLREVQGVVRCAHASR